MGGGRHFYPISCSAWPLKRSCKHSESAFQTACIPNFNLNLSRFVHCSTLSLAQWFSLRIVGPSLQGLLRLALGVAVAALLFSARYPSARRQFSRPAPKPLHFHASCFSRKSTRAARGMRYMLFVVPGDLRSTAWSFPHSI